ncbi:conserved hypothetical protein [Paenibacillus curdlanolyticus YK9]|uniref:Uncharacterized protein n=1 Tax=Paenibacillus curdlanolyticus YK9 TaxID=717606 RepID=E0I6N1_9BACL|nr:hypothetical protein [Paenibacillus curdlanolyticus]EFM11697.1 conserved hypothetical protein [Paenibacillus curdlanolyticus YK9]
MKVNQMEPRLSRANMRIVTVLLAAMLAVVMVSVPLALPIAEAAAEQLTSTAQKQFDKTKAAAVPADAATLQRLYDTFILLQQQNAERDTRLKAASKQNDDNEKTLRQRIQLIDKAKIEKLASKVETVKASGQPIFDQYALAVVQLKAAKKLGSKTLIAFMELQADLLEIRAKAAKAEIQAAEAELKQAKTNASSMMKRLRDQLAAIDKEEKAISPERSAISQLNKQKTSEWSDFTYALRGSDAKSAIRSLTTLQSVLQDIAQRQGTVEGCEIRIAAVIKTVSSQLR